MCSSMWLLVLEKQKAFRSHADKTFEISIGLFMRNCAVGMFKIKMHGVVVFYDSWTEFDF